ncbi:hypothetical protein CP556_01350 [Natrinema sp. CBA1119]|uniref:hypothetical protein n=1 Tax=Natrinema sp. CBA1119 TaxID=1608465 RepID=UPI000BF4194A|nr:hypothetical protein [Natrinema sp. CBA1119]PGF14900.1 hypothetical protein CP556_01350 [Natrinema sp. CBA1119]
MTDRPPSPSTPTAAPAIANTGPEDRVLATTTQLTDSIETALGCRLDETVLKDLLLELDRHDYVDWVTVSRGGDHVWDLSESADRIGDAIAAAITEQVRSWLDIDE